MVNETMGIRLCVATGDVDDHEELQLRKSCSFLQANDFSQRAALMGEESLLHSGT